jgi:hypothetical protein
MNGSAAALIVFQIPSFGLGFWFLVDLIFYSIYPWASG